MKLLWPVAFVLLLASQCHGAKILLVFHFKGYSHYILGHTLAEELARKGHEVTMLRSFEKESSEKNLKFAQMEINSEEVLAKVGNLSVTPEEMLNIGPYPMYYVVHKMGLIASELVFESDAFKKLLHDEKHFDVVIIEQFFSDALKYICVHYNAPCIAFATVGASNINNYLIANPSPTSYVPNLCLKSSAKMSFGERFENFVFTTLTDVANRLYFLPKNNDVIQQHFPNAPHIDDIMSKVSLVFLNSHISVNQPVPHMPNMIEVGGIHVKPTGKIPADIKKFLDEAKEGAILFSLGSNLKSHDLPSEKRDGILKALGKFKEKVLWKFEDDKATVLPPNVKIAKWLPQQDVLGHPNVKLFITHGGLLSLTEAVYFGVPVVGIPFFGDQQANMAEVERTGLGVKLTYPNLNEESLTMAVEKVLGDKRYAETAKKRSAISRDRPMKPLEHAVYWVEYLLRHKTAEHMFPKEAMAMPWFAFYQIDVIALLALIAAVPLVILWGICKFVKSKMCKKDSENHDSKKKRQ